MSSVLAIDIGGTKIAAALVDEAGHIILRRQGPTLAAQGAAAVLARVETLAHEVMAEAPSRPIAVGVGTGGQVDPQDGRIVYATPLLPGWTGLPLRARLEEMLGLPVAVDNDVHAMALGEATFGAGRNLRHLLCIAVGTGIGGATVSDGRLYRGAAGGAGHFGHVSIDAVRGRRCNCGGIGCVEMYASGPAIVAAWLKMAGAVQARAWLGKEPTEIEVRDLVPLLSGSDEPALLARKALYRAGRFLGCAIASLLHAFNPDAVIVGGGVAQAGAPFFLGIREAVTERAMPSMRETPILPAALGTDAGLIGAAVLARSSFARPTEDVDNNEQASQL